MHRRRFLAAAATTGVGALAGCAGVLGVGSGGGTDLELTPGPRQGDPLPPDETPDDGYPPAFDAHPPEQSIDTSTFGTKTVDGASVGNAPADARIEVSLAPIEVTYYWYARGEARFADARRPYQYRASHVYGAINSPANTAIEGTAIGEWPRSDRVVCYCACPHHVSSIRAAELMRAGFEEVHVIDEGFVKWVRKFDYPIAGQNVSDLPAPRVIEGRTDPRDAGGTAWARTRAPEQVEAADIGTDGRYELSLRFYGVDDATEVTVETPSYTVTDTLGALTDGVVAP